MKPHDIIKMKCTISKSEKYTTLWEIILLLRSRYENATLICVGCSVHYWVSCAISKGGFCEIAFVVVLDTHLPRFEALAYVLPHFDAW